MQGERIALEKMSYVLPHCIITVFSSLDKPLQHYFSIKRKNRTGIFFLNLLRVRMYVHNNDHYADGYVTIFFFL